MKGNTKNCWKPICIICLFILVMFSGIVPVKADESIDEDWMEEDTVEEDYENDEDDEEEVNNSALENFSKEDYYAYSSMKEYRKLSQEEIELFDQYYDMLCKNAQNKDGFLINGTILLDYKGKETSITIPDGVTDILGFEGERLKKVVIPDNVEYIVNSFHGEKLVEVKFQDRNGKPLKIGNCCFTELENLQKMNLPDCITEVGCESITNFNILCSLHIPKGLKEIKDCSFNNGYNAKIVVPDSIVKIGNDSLQSCGYIKLPDSIKKYGENALKGSTLLYKNPPFSAKECAKRNIKFYKKEPPYPEKSSLYVVKGYWDHYPYVAVGVRNLKITSLNKKIAIVKKSVLEGEGYLIKGIKEGKTKICIQADGKKYYTDITVLKKTKENRIKQVIHNTTDDSMSTLEKANNVGYWLFEWCCYDYGYVYDGHSSSKHSPHSAESALLDGFAVCDGYAYAYKEILDAMNIPCKVKVGTYKGSGHAWNLVKIGKKWTNVDVSHAVPFVSDNDIKGTYKWNNSAYPKATYNLDNYYVYDVR